MARSAVPQNRRQCDQRGTVGGIKIRGIAGSGATDRNFAVDRNPYAPLELVNEPQIGCGRF